MKFKAIIFDMDGVLIDTERYYVKYREKFFAQHKIDVSHLSNRDFIGGNLRDLWPRILRDDYHSQKAEQLQKEYVHLKKLDPLPYEKLLFPDVPAVLEYLKHENYLLALASSSAMSDIKRMLEIHQLGSFFDVISSGMDCKKAKPDPEVYLSTMKKLGVTPSESLIIEDSENGISAGKAANATVWAIEDTQFGMNQEKADCKIPTLFSVIQKLQNLEK